MDNMKTTFDEFLNEQKSTTFNIKKEIAKMGKELSKDYMITIDHTLPYVSVCKNPSKEELVKPDQTFTPKSKLQYYTKDEYALKSSFYYAQGESASELIDDIPGDVNPEYYLLWYLESAGAFEKEK